MLIIAGGIGNIFVVIAGPAVQYTGRDGWLGVLIAYLIAGIFGVLLVNLGKRFPDKTFVEYLPLVLGKIPGKIAALAYILCFGMISPLILREIIELIKLFLPYTPPLITTIMICVLTMYTMWKGFEVFARAAELFSFFVTLFIVFMIFGISNKVNYSNMLPFMEKGIMPLLRGQLILFPYAVETILFMALWLPCLNKVKDAKRAVIMGMSITGGVLTALVITCTGFFGSNLLEKIIYPVYFVSRNILIRNIFSGFEAIFMILWLFSSYLQLLVFQYPTVIGVAKWLNLKDYKKLIIPISIIHIALSFIPENIVTVLKLDILKNPYVILPVALLIPLAWAVAAIRGIDETE